LNPDGTPKYRQLVSRGTDAWFVGYVPADNPRFVVAAVMEWGGHGVAFGAPIVKEAIVQLQKHRYLPSADNP
jgi:cell division protein FtsI/penicillin-binding protein 2